MTKDMVFKTCCADGLDHQHSGLWCSHGRIGCMYMPPLCGGLHFWQATVVVSAVLWQLSLIILIVMHTILLMVFESGRVCSCYCCSHCVTYLTPSPGILVVSQVVGTQAVLLVSEAQKAGSTVRVVTYTVISYH